MTTEQVNELLVNIISAYSPRFGRAITRSAALKLVTTSAEAQIQKTGGNTFAPARAAFAKCGIILEESEERGVLAGVIMSGAANMNPAFVALWTEGSNVRIKASAKEGLIKQHTAEKAIELFKCAFSDEIEALGE